MSKEVFEVAADITQEALKARSEALSIFASSSYTGKEELVNKYLSDEAIIELYEKIYKKIKEV